MMSSGPVPLLVLVLLFLATTITKGLTAGHDGFTSCSGGRGAFVDSILCDPDHLVSPEESYNIGQFLTKCSAKPEDVKMVMFLAANFTPDAHTTGTWNASTSVGATTNNDKSNGSGGGGGDTSNIHLLKERIVTSYHLNSRATATSNKTTSVTSSSIILLVAIQDPFQLATWHSETLDGMLPKDTLEEAKQQVDTPIDQRQFTSAVVHVAHQLCQSVRRSESRPLRDIILTVVWIAFTAAFITLLIVIVMALLRGRYRAVTSNRAAAGQEQGKRTQARRQHLITSASDFQDLGAMYNKTSGNVLLGTTDITAVLPQDCSSTDNLLQG